MTWGLIPKLEVPSYDVMRNRKMLDGKEWLNSNCKAFFKTKLYNTNKEYSNLKKSIYTITYPLRLVVWFLNDGKNNFYRVKKHLFRIIKWKKEND